MKTTIFFDFDGTLVDCERFQTQNLKKVFEKYHVKTSKINFKELIGPPLVNTFKTFIKTENPQKVLKEYNDAFNAKDIKDIFLFDGILDLLKTIRKLEYKIYVVSLQVKEIILAELKYLNLTDLIDGVFCDDPQKAYTSKSDLVKDVLQQEKLNIQEIVFVGDSINDVSAGKKNNILTIGVNWGYGNLKMSDVSYLVNNTMQLKELLKTIKNDA